MRDRHRAGPTVADPVMSALPFSKMHGLGNDFVVIDARVSDAVINPALARALGDRRTGIGFDQLILLLPSTVADRNSGQPSFRDC